MKNLGIIIFLVFMSLPVWAGQVLFKRDYLGNEVLLTYQWKDYVNQTQSLVFRLPKNDVALGNSEFKPFDNDAAITYVVGRLQAYAQTQSHGRQRVEVRRQGEGFQVLYYNMTPRLQEKIDAELDRRQKEAMQEYVASVHYMMYGNRVSPDHRHIAQRYANAMLPIARLVKRQFNREPTRVVLNYLLNFLQTIPYDQLLDRTTSNGAGFQTPYGLLLNNRGDCDTKSVTLAALLRRLYPHQRIIIVYVENHAFVGFEMPSQRGDRTLQVAGSTFVLLDPTGPGYLLAGQVQNQALRYLSTRQYSYQEVPF